MKRPIFIIIGIVLVFVLLGVWVYILFFGAPDDGAFGNFNFSDSNDDTVVIVDGQDEEKDPVVDVKGPERLRQLTTQPTAGYQVVQKDASSTPEVYYVEAGTGHVFSIDLESGEETRISNKTVPLSRKAAITPNGQFVMIQAGSGVGRETVVLEIGTSSVVNTIELSDRIFDFVSTVDNTFLFGAQAADSATIKHYLPASDDLETAFTVPFREASIDWGESISDVHYIYPKTAGQLEGFVYQSSGGSISRLPADGFGLSVHGNNEHLVYSKQVDGLYRSYFYNLNEDKTTPLGFTVIPEKCTTSSYSESNIICASDNVAYDINIPDDWYRGVVSYSDNLWQINTKSGSASLILNAEQESGRQLDIMNMTMMDEEANIFFINKNDQTLWLFDQFAE